MLSNALNTNEIKNAAGTEVEFQHLEQVGRLHRWCLVNETPNLPHRLSIQHAESGSGIGLRRRSVVRVDKTTLSTVDPTRSITNTFYIVGDIAVGAISDMTEPKNVLAELMSFCATTGAATTVLFDCSGNGAQALIQGSL